MSDNGILRILEITHAWLVTANVHYRSIGELIKGLLHLENFEALVVKGPSPTKIIKTLVLSSLASDSSSCSFGFRKCSGRPGSVK